MTFFGFPVIFLKDDGYLIPIGRNVGCHDMLKSKGKVKAGRSDEICPLDMSGEKGNYAHDPVHLCMHDTCCVECERHIL